MKSPRFDVRAKKLKNIFSPENIERIWKEKVRTSMREQFINDGIENFYFHITYKIECKKLSSTILLGDYIPQKSRRILVEKSKGLCRQIAIPSVRDAIVLQCLSDALYSEVKGKAPTSKSFFEPKDHSFSNFMSGYGTFASWLNFQKALFNFSKNRNYIVVTDIANYYDSISYTHLRNSISSISGVDECIIDMLIFVLSDLLWQPDYTPRVEIGLPQINLDAPRLLAHCFLYELDEYLNSCADIDFVRYMDDIDIGVDSIVEAKKVLKSVDLLLQTKQVRLNSGKTTILSRVDAIKHFRVKENARLDILKNIIEKRLKNKKSITRARRLIELRISRGMQKKQFDNGNGDKILKRWIGLAAQTGASIKPVNIKKIVEKRPSTRSNIYSWVRSRVLTPSIAQALSQAASSGLLTDEAAMVEMSNHLVETLVPKNNCHKYIIEIINQNDTNTFYGLYSKIWMQSKYDTTENLLRTLKDSQKLWTPSEHMGRLAGAILPIFYGSPEENVYKELLSTTLNSGVRETYKFHLKLSQEKQTFDLMFDALKSPNKSRGTGITHAKFLCLISALKNTSVNKSIILNLKSKNPLPFSDAYYKGIAKRLNI